MKSGGLYPKDRFMTKKYLGGDDRGERDKII
jgi:hypothetical protein